MTLDALWQIVSGSAGALGLLFIAVLFLIHGRVVPRYVLEGAEARVGALEAENTRLHEAVLQLTEQNIRFDTEMKALVREVKRLRVEIGQLQKRARNNEKDTAR